MPLQKNLLASYPDHYLISNMYYDTVVIVLILG